MFIRSYEIHLCTLAKVSTENVCLLNGDWKFTAVILLMVEVTIFLAVVGSTNEVSLAVSVVEMVTFIDVGTVSLTYKIL